MLESTGPTLGTEQSKRLRSRQIEFGESSWRVRRQSQPAVSPTSGCARRGCAG